MYVSQLQMWISPANSRSSNSRLMVRLSARLLVHFVQRGVILKQRNAHFRAYIALVWNAGASVERGRTLFDGILANYPKRCETFM